MIGNSDPGFGEVLVSNMFTCGAAGDGMSFAGYNYTVWLSAIRIMELTGFGPSHRLKTHNASLPLYHSEPALPMAQTSWRNTLSLSILLLWWVERYSEWRKTHDWLMRFNCFRAALSTRLHTSAKWKLALHFKRVKQDILICGNYFECPGQWIIRWKKYARGQISFRPSSRMTDITYWEICCCPLEAHWWQKTVLYVFSLLSTT